MIVEAADTTTGRYFDAFLKSYCPFRSNTTIYNRPNHFIGFMGNFAEFSYATYCWGKVLVLTRNGNVSFRDKTHH